jgi:hypothetical protein
VPSQKLSTNLAFDTLVGGSLASSIYGVPRATQDVDLVADITSESVAPFQEKLANSFYIDADMIREAIARRASFNIVHLKTMFSFTRGVSRGRLVITSGLLRLPEARYDSGLRGPALARRRRLRTKPLTYSANGLHSPGGVRLG